jgi:hypothetical protein
LDQAGRAPGRGQRREAQGAAQEVANHHQALDLLADAPGDGRQHEIERPQRLSVDDSKDENRMAGAGEDRHRFGPKVFAPEGVGDGRFVEAAHHQAVMRLPRLGGAAYEGA